MIHSHFRVLTPFVAAVALFASQASFAGPGYSATGFTTTGANAPQVLAAYEKLNAAPLMKESKSRAMLLANVVDGANPATHTFVVSFPSMAESESFAQRLYADPAWTEFVSALSQLGTVAETMRFSTLRSWGEISDADVVWDQNAFHVTNPAAFAATLERFMVTPTGKAFPGQVHLVAVSAAGITSATHGIVVGWASQAEAEAWGDKNANNGEWLAYLAESALSSEFLGNSISRTLAAHGPTLKSTLGR